MNLPPNFNFQQPLLDFSDIPAATVEVEFLLGHEFNLYIPVRICSENKLYDREDPA